MEEMKGKVALITGASSGIGRATAVKFAAEGADVVCVSRSAENSEKVAGEVRALGRKAWAFAVDVADASAVAAAAVQPFSLVAVVIFYFDRRARTEGLDLEIWADRLQGAAR